MIKDFKDLIEVIFGIALIGIITFLYLSCQGTSCWNKGFDYYTFFGIIVAGLIALASFLSAATIFLLQSYSMGLCRRMDIINEILKSKNYKSKNRDSAEKFIDEIKKDSKLLELVESGKIDELTASFNNIINIVNERRNIKNKTRTFLQWSLYCVIAGLTGLISTPFFRSDIPIFLNYHLGFFFVILYFIFSAVFLNEARKLMDAVITKANI